MISKLKGLVDEIGDTWVIIDVQGVGYHLSCSRSTLSNLPPLSEATTLWVETIFKAEQLSLYGFISPEEKAAFTLLSTVQGVGSRVALSLLSAVTPAEIVRAITLEDHAALTPADGVGPKLAQRITRELKGKEAGFLKGITSPGNEIPLIVGNAEDDVVKDAVSALLNLGYRRPEIMIAIAKVQSETGSDITLDRLIPAALQFLGRKF